LNVIVLFLFAVALMGAVAANLIADPAYVLGLFVLSTIVTFGLSAITALLFAGAGRHSALPLAHAAGSRNTGLMLAAAAGQVPDLVWLYVALIQIPIYAPQQRPIAADRQTLRLVLGVANCACRLMSCFSKLLKLSAFELELELEDDE